MSVQSILADLVQETTEQQGTGAYNLEGPSAGFVSFASQFADGAEVAYVVRQEERDSNGNLTGVRYEHLVGTLTYGSPDTLSRDAIVQSSNGNSAVDWGPGTKDVFCAPSGPLLPAMKAALAAARQGRPLVVNGDGDAFTTGNPGVGQRAGSELTIASGSVTPDRFRHTVDTESDAGTDDLTHAATTNIADGGLLLISAANAARVPTVKHEAGGAGQFHLADDIDMALSGTDTSLTLERRGADWYEVARSQIGPKAVTLAKLADLASGSMIAGDDDGRPASHALLASLVRDNSAKTVGVAPAFTPGMYSNLRVSRPSVATVDVDADFVTVFDSSGNGRKLFNVNLTLNMATSGAGGLSTGVESANAWYYIHIIYNPTTDTVSGIFDVSATSPTLPSGYTFSKLYSAVRNSSSNFIDFNQRDDFVQYALPLALSSGATGTYSSSFATTSVSALVPTAILKTIRVFVTQTSGTSNGITVAPADTYATNATSATSSPCSGVCTADMVLLGTNVYISAQANSLSSVPGYSINI